MKKTIDMVAIPVKKANAQSLTCFVAFVTSAVLAAVAMIVAGILPVLVKANEITCWICMLIEVVSIGLGYIAFWIKTKAL